MTSEKLAALRAQFAAHQIDGYLVPRSDEHLGEYVPPSAERLAWLTGFTGSAGVAIVLPAEAAVFADGRYVLQLAQQTDAALFEALHFVDQPPEEWAAARAKRLGYDPWLVSEDLVKRYGEAGLAMVPVDTNLVDAVWADRPDAPDSPMVAHPFALAGEAAAAKIAAVAEALQQAGQDAAVLSDPASIAWLLNVRGADLPYVPVALALALVHATGLVELFIDPARVSGAALDPAVSVQPRAAFGAALAGLAGRRVRVDAAGSPAAVAQALRGAGAEVCAGADPCLLPKARKNAVEQAGARAAHRRDGMALCRFLQWLEGAAGETELSAAERLLALRQEDARFRGESFPAISGAGEHGAVVHYRVTPQSNRAIGPNEVYLIDSGGQYADGTTDVTRTVWTGPGAPPPALRAVFTRVLQGMIALAATVFPRGVAGPHLDAIARQALWADMLDYDHGTGHGVGSYLSVHEGPASVSRAAKMVPLEPGMILSDEPGYYEPGAYGIRCEVLLLVQAVPRKEGAREFRRFEVLTLAPFDRRLIDPAMLTLAQRAWLNAYHTRVAAELGPLGDAGLRAWLTQACAPLTAD